MTARDVSHLGDRARAVADAVLHEGYVLYPYRASAPKNRARWQFGVLTPPAWQRVDPYEPSYNQAECLLVAPLGSATLHVTARFIQVETRVVEEWTGTTFRPVDRLEVGGDMLVSWDEGVDREFSVSVPLRELAADELRKMVTLPPSSATEIVRTRDGQARGRVRRERGRLSALLRVAAEPLNGAEGLRKIRVRTENTTEWDDPGEDRTEAVRRSLVAAHVILVASGGRFVSLTDPPDWARHAARGCENLRCWPALVGEPGDHSAVLASPIILQDHPAVAPESPGDFYDATEIDELLALRTATLTEAEKEEARATDPRAAEVVDRADAMPAEALARLHGAIRSLRAATGSAREPEPAEPGSVELPEWWTPEAESAVSPETETVVVAGIEVGCGATVKLRPTRGRADAQDMFLDGRRATVHAVFRDVDGAQRRLAVTVDDDPAAELLGWDRRYLYFGVDEVEPVGAWPGPEDAP